MIPGRIPNPFRGSIVLNKAFFRTVEICGCAKDLVERRYVGLEAMIPRFEIPDGGSMRKENMSSLPPSLNAYNAFEKFLP